MVFVVVSLRRHRNETSQPEVVRPFKQTEVLTLSVLSADAEGRNVYLEHDRYYRQSKRCVDRQGGADAIITSNCC